MHAARDRLGLIKELEFAAAERLRALEETTAELERQRARALAERPG
jgi:hypothetical protein